MHARYEPIIGLEVHAQMRTETKAFCGCSTAYGSDPNANVCPVCLGHPGVLPVLNGKLVEFVMRMGIATHCRIRERSTFARKNYFYPDLPKGYQISQYEDPICHDGWIEIEQPDETRRRIGITRIHMEEDAGKSIHDSSDFTLVDLNRCGIPLIEIVSQPDLRSPEEAYLYLTQIRRIVTYLGICDGNMEEGSLRCDANVSIRKKGDTAFGTKTELKNMNSFRNVERALAFEIDRQTEILETGGTVVQETLLWDAGKNVAVSMRSKEEAHDYRYFPEPDLVPVHVTEEWKRTLAASLPELPLERRDRFMREYSLPRYDADVLTSEAGLADYYEGICRAVEPKNAETFRSAGNWVQGDFLRLMKEKRRELSDNPFPASHLAELVNLIGSGAVSGKMGKEILEEMFDTGENPSRIIERKGMAQVSDTAVIEPIIDKILAENPDSIRKYFKGRTQVFGFFVGQVMKETKGQANPQRVNEILTAKLEQMKGKE